MMPAGGYAGHHPQLSGGACPIPKEKPYIDKAFLLQKALYLDFISQIYVYPFFREIKTILLAIY